MGRLFRRVVRTARGPRRASRGSTVRSSDGRQYRVVAVNRVEDTEFADPPRKWGRVGLMAGVWALALAFGGWIAPTVAASGNPENVDSQDQPASSAKQTTYRYLQNGSDLDVEQAKAELCDGASPETSPADLNDLRQKYETEKKGITRIDVTTGTPVEGPDGITVAGTVSYISDAKPVYEDFLVTARENGDGSFCVLNAVHLPAEEPGPDEGSGEPVEPRDLAAEFMRSFIGEEPNPQAAVDLQCSDYTGITPTELDAAIKEWGTISSFLSSVDDAESSEASIKAFTVEVKLKRELEELTVNLVVGVQGDCIASMTGGDGLL